MDFLNDPATIGLLAWAIGLGFGGFALLSGAVFYLRRLISQRTKDLHDKIDAFQAENKADHTAAQQSRDSFQRSIMDHLIKMAADIGEIKGRGDGK